MASFTDSISQFNPYIQQLPVDMMTKVGMYKQAQYDQGVQKIQSYIDNVAGMDVMHEDDKAYLQSKLNELGGKLRTVAAGDFSNQQLVNSVGGMATQIIKDENVRNAVYSTANARKQEAQIEADKKNGKLNTSSEYIYNKQLGEYLSSKGVGQRFSGIYKPKVSDYNKKILEAVKIIQPQVTQEDLVWATDPTTGRPIPGKIAEVMQRYTNKRVDEGQIRTVISSVLNADDVDQMQMDGVYNFRDKNDVDVSDIIAEKTQESIDIAAQRLKILRTRLPGITDPDQKLSVEKQIKEYEAKLGDPGKGIPGQLLINQKNLIDSLSDPRKLDQVKGQIYYSNVIDEYANAFAYADIRNEVMKSPYQEQENWREEQAFKRQVEANDQYDKAFNRKMKTREDIRAEAKAGREQGEYDQKMNPTGGPSYTGVGDETEQKRNSVRNWVNDKNSYVAQNRILKNQLKDKMGGMFNDLTDAEVESKIEEYRKDPVRNKPDDNSVKEIMDSYLANQRYIAKKNIMFNESLKKATDKVTGGKGIQGLLAADLAAIPGLSIPGTKGKVNFTPSEVLDYVHNFEKVSGKTFAFLPIVGGGNYSTVDATQLYAKGLMSPKEYELYNYFKKTGRYEPSRKGFSTDDNVNRYMSKLQPSRQKYAKLKSDIAEEQVNILSPYAGAFKTEGAGITFSGKEGDTKQNFIDKLRTLVSNDFRQKGGDIRYDAEGTLENLAAKGSDQLLSFGVERQGNKYYIQVQDQAGDIQNIPVSSDFIKKNLGAQWLNKGADTQMQMFSMGGNTNPTKNVELAQYAPNDFGNYDSGQKSVTLDIYADLKDQGNGNGAVTFHLKNKRGETIPIVWPGRSGITNIDNFKQWLSVQSDGTLIPLLRQLYPGVDNFLKR